MNAKELIESLLDESGYQFRACLNEVSEESFSASPLPGVMSLRECVGHVMEAYQAVITHVAGGKHSWGTYVAPSGSMSELLAAFDALRAEAVAAGMSVFEASPEYLKDYVVLHEVYHVGQMASVRQALADGWEPYSIYRH